MYSVRRFFVGAEFPDLPHTSRFGGFRLFQASEPVRPCVGYRLTCQVNDRALMRCPLRCPAAGLTDVGDLVQDLGCEDQR